MRISDWSSDVCSSDLVFPWDPINSFRLFEVTKYHLDARSYTASFYFVMNKKKYDSLPADVKTAIDDTTGDALAVKFGDWWNAWDAPGLEAARKKGNVITPLTDAERARRRAALKPTIDQLLGALRSHEHTSDLQSLMHNTY